MNLRPPSEEHPTTNRWEEIGVWNSEKDDGRVDIKDIVWPGEALKPPEGVPERGFLTVTFLEVRFLSCHYHFTFQLEKDFEVKMKMHLVELQILINMIHFNKTQNCFNFSFILYLLKVKVYFLLSKHYKRNKKVTMNIDFLFKLRNQQYRIRKEHKNENILDLSLI